MPFDNKYFLGVTVKGYQFMIPPTVMTDDEAIEVAALIIAMKPLLRRKFNERLKAIMGGE